MQGHSFHLGYDWKVLVPQVQSTITWHCVEVFHLRWVSGGRRGDRWDIRAKDDTRIASENQSADSPTLVSASYFCITLFISAGLFSSTHRSGLTEPDRGGEVCDAHQWEEIQIYRLRIQYLSIFINKGYLNSYAEIVLIASMFMTSDWKWHFLKFNIFSRYVNGG